MILGVDYYPEHWPEERWPIDARLMQALGLDVVRLAEFAWALLEPEEGRFEWAWLDRAIDVLTAEDLQIVLGTPTAAPPAWLSRTYPETLPVDAEGRIRNFGSRRHYCPNSDRYRELTLKVVTAMAERYAGHPHVIGWQVDNEWGGGRTGRCYCSHCAAAFRRWLQRRYGTIEALNEAWAAVFWSQLYSDWWQIEPPVGTGSAPNPSQVLDYDRFASDSWVEYQQLQLYVLHEAMGGARRQFVTTNLMGLYADIDYYDVAAPLDFVSWDNYPTGNAHRWREMLYGEDPLPTVYAHDVGDPAITGMAHDLTRGLKGAPFWIMEQQPGHINWGAYNTGVRSGTVRLWSWHAAASGADGLIYFRWRACRFAQEQYHSGLLRHDGSFDVGYDDLLTMQGERAELEALTSEPVVARVALLFDYEDLWALRTQPHSRAYGYLRHLFVYYRALQRLGVPVDLIAPGGDLDRYPLVLAPVLHLADAPLAAALSDYVTAGGRLLLGVRSGFKTPTNLVTDEPLPGPFRELTGATVTEWHALPPRVGYPFESDLPGLHGPATLWAEALATNLPEVRELAVYTGGPLAGYAALTERRAGEGHVYYHGWYPTLPQARALLDYLLAESGVERLADLPEGLVAARRGDRLVLLNFTDAPLTATVAGFAVTVAPRDVTTVVV